MPKILTTAQAAYIMAAFATLEQIGARASVTLNQTSENYFTVVWKDSNGEIFIREMKNLICVRREDYGDQYHFAKAYGV